jgi:peptidyl-prolyl cis-trans isomerase D
MYFPAGAAQAGMHGQVGVNMLQNIRKSSQGTVAKVIVGAIIVTFALFGVDSIVGGLGGEPEVAEVNGEGIPESMFKRTVENKKRQMLAQMGEQADPDLIDEALLNASVLDGLIKTEILYQDAEGKGIHVADALLNSTIAGNDAFHVDGKFSNEQLQMLLRPLGLTVQDYKQALARDFMINQPRSAIMASAFLMPEERDRIVRLDRQQRSFGLATVTASSYHDSIAVSDENVESYYEENRAKYVKPESVDVSFVELTRASLTESVIADEEQLKKMYEAERATFESEERRDASHILVKVDETRSEPEALDRIKQIAERLDQGEDFAAVAKAESEDEGSAAKGGNLGLSGRGVYVDAFEEALFSLDVGVVSEPVRTEFGYHLIRVDGIQKDEFSDFESMRPVLEQRYVTEQSERLFREKVERLADSSYASSDLSEPAEELGLEVKSLVSVSSQSSDRIFSAVKIQKVLFSEELVNGGENSAVIEIEDGHAVVFRVDAYHEAGIHALSAVKEQIRQELIEQKAREFAKSVGEAFLVRIVAGEDPTAVAAGMGLKWQQHDNVRRDNFTLDQTLVERVFALPESAGAETGSVHTLTLPNGDFAVVKLISVDRQQEVAITSVEKQGIDSMLSRSLGAVDYSAYESVALKSAEVERM